MEITWNRVALNARQLKQQGITHESSVVMVSSKDNTQIGDITRFALQSLGSPMVEVNVPSESNAENAVGMRNLLSEVLTASDFIVDCTEGILSTLLGYDALNETGTQVLVYDNLDWVLATPS
ncbi:MAG TPA: hypothetical protein QF850_04330 [Acidimicrobiales bacterium]|nr:hypothetical protein [Acidimicrobiales bacterium]|tara:strand:+ start:1248 stop:1613 length:366 start_codon:yes stop_codon:yes gene_type:complete